MILFSNVKDHLKIMFPKIQFAALHNEARCKKVRAMRFKRDRSHSQLHDQDSQVSHPQNSHVQEGLSTSSSIVSSVLSDSMRSEVICLKKSTFYFSEESHSFWESSGLSTSKSNEVDVVSMLVTITRGTFQVMPQRELTCQMCWG